MSMQFDQPMDKKTSKRIKEMFGDNIVVMDAQNVLLENLSEIHQKQMKVVADTSKQPITMNIHDEDDIVEMTDGTKYQVTPKGWQKI